MFQPRFSLRRVAWWRHFEHKGYSAFRSLGKVVAISVLTVSTLASATGRAYAAEGHALEPGDQWDDPGGAISLDDLQVTASASSLEAARAARIVTVVTREEIQELPVACISDILKLASAVDVRQRGGLGVQADISIDGGTYDQVSILLNGINITSPQTGHYSADWPVNIDDIERIEIIEGAASRYMGASSLMGAVNIVTRRAATAGLSVKAEGGSYGTCGAQASGHMSTGRFSHSLSAAGLRSDGGTVNSEMRRSQAYYNGRLSMPCGDVTAQLGWSRLDHGANTFYSGAYPDQHDALDRWVASASATINTVVKIEPAIYWQRLYDHYQLKHNTSFGENFHRTDVVGGRLGLSANWAAGRTALSGELRRESIYSTTLGRPLQTPRPANDSVDYTCHDARNSLSLSAEHIVMAGPVTVSAGIVAAINTGLDHRLRFYPGIDASWSVTPHLRLLASYGRSYRMPTFTDLYYKAPTHEGNRDLRPERMVSWQAGAQWVQGAAGLRAMAFYHRGHNMIDWVMYRPEDVFHAAGFDLDNMGITTQGHIDLAQWLGSSQPLLRIDAGYTYMHQKRRDPVEIYESRSALEYLRHKFTATLTHRLWKNATATWGLRWQDRVGDYLLYTDGASQGRLEPYRPYATLDLRVDWKASPHWLVGLSATNLTDHTYYDCANIPQPGLWVMGSLTYTL